jgi:glycosyltransferase involved in cell wall biosynthesis
MQDQRISFVIVNNLGGITSLVNNLIQFRGPAALPQELVLLDIAGNRNASALLSPLIDVEIRHFPISPRHNLYKVYGRLAADLRETGGVLVSNDAYDLLMLTRFNLPKKCVQIVHDGYNVKLAIQFEAVVDVFICHSVFFYEALRQILHHRREDIFHIPYGIPLSGAPRESRLHERPLRLLFLGRHAIDKGVYDLFEINRLMQQRNIAVEWMILGKGPETEQLKQQWKQEVNVAFHTPSSGEELLRLATTNDLFVFPTKFEGFPVALVETMSLGCVPVVSDLPGGIRELVDPDETGFRCTSDDPAAFAAAIERLHLDRRMLDRMSENAYARIYAGFNARIQSPIYQRLFDKIAKDPVSPRHHAVRKKLGSRLDQPWIPNSIVKFLRKAKAPR